MKGIHAIVALMLLSTICLADEPMIDVISANCTCDNAGLTVELTLLAKTPVVVNLQPLQEVGGNKVLCEGTGNLPNFWVLTSCASWSGEMATHLDGRCPNFLPGSPKEMIVPRGMAVPIQVSLPPIGGDLRGFIALSFRSYEGQEKTPAIISGSGEKTGLSSTPVQLRVVDEDQKMLFLPFRGEGRVVIGPVKCETAGEDECECRMGRMYPKTHKSSDQGCLSPEEAGHRPGGRLLARTRSDDTDAEPVD